VKLRDWETTQLLTALLGAEEDAYLGIASSSLNVRKWIVRPGFTIYQKGDEICIGVDGLLGSYFVPSLDKITAESIAKVGRMIIDASLDDDGWGDPLIAERAFT
jgi:hypothetical protein